MKSMLALLLFLIVPARLLADVQITETASSNGGGHASRGTRVTSIRGLRMRVDTAMSDAVVSTLYDLPAGTTIRLYPEKKRAESRDIRTAVGAHATLARGGAYA